jgi:hypothetical protein
MKLIETNSPLYIKRLGRAQGNQKSYYTMKTTVKKEYTKNHPVNQNKKTGKWGYERVNDSLNFNRCIFNTKQEAEKAREESAVCYAEQ